MKIRLCNLLLLSLLLVAFLTSWGMCSDPADIYQLDVRLSPESQQLDGEARLNISKDRLAAGLSLRLSSHAKLLEVTLDGQPADFSFSGENLVVEPPPGITAEISNLSIRYRVHYADPLPQTTVGMENPSFGVSATIGEVGAYLSSGTAWFPQPQKPPGKYRIRVEGPAGLYGVTSGKLLEHGTADGQSYTQWETSFTLDGLALSAGYYQIFEEQVGEIQVLAFLTDKNAALATAYLDPTKIYLQFYQRLLGPYPFTKFAIVENFLPTGYGLPSWTLLGSNVIALPFIPHTSLPHEIVHSWFGNAVEVDYQSGNWAEGLTSYLSDYLLKEQRSEELGREHRLKLLRDYAALVTPQQDYPLTEFVSRTSKRDQAIGYGKAAMVFHMLRRQIGEEFFWPALRRLVSAGTGKRFGWKDLKRVFSDESGQDLTVFFQQWIEQPGAPQFHFDKVSVVERDGGLNVQGEIIQNDQLYSLDLPLHLKTEAGSIDQPVSLSKRKESFVIKTDAPVQQLSGDPDAHLFRRLQPNELPATINDLRASRELLVVAHSPRDRLLEASADLLRGLQKSSARVISWGDFDPDMAKQYDLLFIGWPPEEMFDGILTMKIQAEQDSFYWKGFRYQDAKNSIFICQKNTGTEQRLMAVFHPLSAEAARKVARKIPHYGRYSYLVFKDGANLVKGTNEPGESPLQINLN